jgi:hypothetical protein
MFFIAFFKPDCAEAVGRADGEAIGSVIAGVAAAENLDTLQTRENQ